MLDKKQVIEKMRERGFTEMSRQMKNTYDIVAIFFITEPTYRKRTGTIQTPSIGCNVNLEKETFEFKYIVPNSINCLCSPECGSLFNDDHFDNLCFKFEEQASILYRYFGRN